MGITEKFIAIHPTIDHKHRIVLTLRFSDVLVARTITRKVIARLRTRAIVSWVSYHRADEWTGDFFVEITVRDDFDYKAVASALIPPASNRGVTSND